MKRAFLLGSMFLVASNLFAQEPIDPLYTGTLLQFYGQNVDPGSLSITSYVYFLRQYGIYNSHWNVNHNPQFNIQTYEVFLETGITKWVDFNLNLYGITSQVHGRSTLAFSDLQAYLGFQLIKSQKETWVPDVRLLIGENFPTGQYQHLNPKKQGADVSGSGSYGTIVLLVLDKVYYHFPTHPISLNLNVYYTWLTKVHVRGVNAYGGAVDTKGVVNPGNQFTVNLSAEFSLTRNWVAGLDVHYLHTDRSSFRGAGGAGLSSSEQWSLAPCLEYNFSDHMSVEWGAWFSVAGRNAPAFAGGVGSFYWAF